MTVLTIVVNAAIFMPGGIPIIPMLDLMLSRCDGNESFDNDYDVADGWFHPDSFWLGPGILWAVLWRAVAQTRGGVVRLKPEAGINFLPEQKFSQLGSTLLLEQSGCWTTQAILPLSSSSSSSSSWYHHPDFHIDHHPDHTDCQHDDDHCPAAQDQPFTVKNPKLDSNSALAKKRRAKGQPLPQLQVTMTMTMIMMTAIMMMTMTMKMRTTEHY